MSGPRLGAMSNNRWSGVTIECLIVGTISGVSTFLRRVEYVHFFMDGNDRKAKTTRPGKYTLNTDYRCGDKKIYSLTLCTYTVKALNLAPRGNFETYLSRNLAYNKPFLQKNSEGNRSLRISLVLKTWFYSLFAPILPKEATELTRTRVCYNEVKS